MSVRPGQNLIWAAGMLAVAALLVSVWAPFAFVLLAVAVVIAGAAYHDYRQLSAVRKGVSITREVPAVVGRDLPFTISLELTNGCPTDIRGELRDVAPDAALPQLTVHHVELASQASDEFAQNYRIARRGEHIFGPVWLRLHGPWKLVDLQWKLDCQGGVKVLPETFASREELVKDLGAEVKLLDKITLTRQHGAGTEFESLHPYRYGDDPRRIDWRTTARSQFPVVRRYQVERHRDVMILIDCGRLMGADTVRGSKLDCAVDSGLNLARVALQSGDRCGLGVFDDRVRGFLPPISGVSSIRALAESVYDLQTAWRESDFTQMFAELQLRQTKRSLIVVISDISDVETSRQFRTSLARLGKRHLVLFAALRTPLLNEIVHSKMDNILEGSRKAVTFRLLRERQQSLHSLGHHGVHVVDVEPQQLTLPLVNQFIELRRRNLL